MKKLLVIFVAIIALYSSSFAQKKAAFDPCSSKNPKIRATSKKPCPTTPAAQKTDVTISPKETAADETADNKNDSPSKNRTPKNDEGSGAMFFISIERDGAKTDVAYTEFDTHDGQASKENEQSNRMLIFYGASNNVVGNDASFSFQGMIPTAAKGTYSIGTNGVSFSFQTSKFPKNQMLLCQSGGYEITAMPAPEGIVAKPTRFVEGTFSCTGENFDDSGNKATFTITGRFKLPRVS